MRIITDEKGFHVIRELIDLATMTGALNSEKLHKILECIDIIAENEEK